MLKIKSNNLLIKNFTIYAERHSGTNFLEKYISQTFHDLPITWDYGWKHWFGFFNKKIIDKGTNTLFIGIVRDPYDWLMALRRMPHHLRGWDGRMDHNPYMDDMDFLNSKIESYHQGLELKYGCKYGSDHHFYENRRYKDIFELRETKNRYLIDKMPEIASNYILVNYEIFNKDINKFVITLNSNFNLKFKNFIPNINNKKSYPVSAQSLTIINNNLNWHTENILGYEKRI
jgi:hypothetical protein